MSRSVFEKIKKLLDDNKISYQLLTHEPVYTSEQAAQMRGKGIEEGLKRGAKAMIFKADEKYVQCIVPAHKIVDLKKVKLLLNAKKIKMATPEEVLQITDCEIGSVPPFGNLCNISVYCDKELSEEIDFNAGLHDTSITMKRIDWERIVKPIVCDIAKERAAS
jgi:Ala-tRNA(Pro) deacylase